MDRGELHKDQRGKTKKGKTQSGKGVSRGTDAGLKTYLTINELSKYLKVSKPTIYVWITKKTIPYIRINKRVIRFEIEAVNEFMRKNEVA
jgi:excisionase family DNA binding protein